MKKKRMKKKKNQSPKGNMAETANLRLAGAETPDLEPERLDSRPEA